MDEVKIKKIIRKKQTNKQTRMKKKNPLEIVNPIKILLNSSAAAVFGGV